MKPLVDEAITTTLRLPGGFDAFLPCCVAVVAHDAGYLAGVVRRHRKKIGSCWRKLNPGRQTLLVLVHLRTGETFAALAAGFGVGTATAWRYVQETVALLAARAAKLDTALGAAPKAGHAFVVIDGTLIPIDRLAADQPFYSGNDERGTICSVECASAPCYLGACHLACEDVARPLASLGGSSQCCMAKIRPPRVRRGALPAHSQSVSRPP